MCKVSTDFYPRPPGGGRQFQSEQNHYCDKDFYPRPPGGGRHTCSTPPTRRSLNFYPRPPGGGRPCANCCCTCFSAISIHALRVEGDVRAPASRRLRSYFYPRPPGGGRLEARRRDFEQAEFLSTPSGWRATISSQIAMLQLRISIHALRVEGDFCRQALQRATYNFYPRPPGGGRRVRKNILYVFFYEFLSTPSGWRATWKWMSRTESCA